MEAREEYAALSAFAPAHFHWHMAFGRLHRRECGPQADQGSLPMRQWENPMISLSGQVVENGRVWVGHGAWLALTWQAAEQASITDRVCSCGIIRWKGSMA